MRSKKKVERENTALRGQVDELREILQFSFETTRIGIVALAGNMPPDERDLAIMADEFPRWSVECKTIDSGFNGEKRAVVKHFRRRMDDLRPDLRDDRDTYLRFTDPEYFDLGLTGAFKLASADPDMGYISGSGDFGTYSHIQLTVEGEAGLTKLDLIRIKAAEQYLVGQDVLAEPVAA